MTTIPTSGCTRRRAKAIARREYLEDAAFYRDGTIPPSATAAAICSCGARSFTRSADGEMGDFDEAHSYCGEDVDA